MKETIECRRRSFRYVECINFGSKMMKLLPFEV